MKNSFFYPFSPRGKKVDLENKKFSQKIFHKKDQKVESL